MRIAVLCGASYVSGMEINALTVIKGLLQQGHEIQCLVSGWNDGTFISRLEEIGVPYQTVYLGKFSRSLRPRYLWWSLNALLHLPAGRRACRRALRRFRPHCVLVYNRDWALLAGFVLRSMSVVFHLNEIPDPAPWPIFLYRRVDRLTRVFVPVSKFMGERLLQYGIAPEKIRVVYNGVNAHVPRVQRSGTDDRVVFGVVGQIGEWKGHDDVVDAVRLLKERGVEFECAIFGTGDSSYVQSIRDKIDRHGLADVVSFRGFVSDQRAIYGEMDICVVPSRFSEAFGLVAVEAGLHEIPVVATRRGGLPEIIRDGETGFLVPMKAPEELADRIARLAGDAQLRRRMGSAARQRVMTHFTEDRMVAEIDAICREFASASGGS